MIWSYLNVSLFMMRAKPVRAILSLLGIYIGVMALVLILSIREGVSRQLRDIYRTNGASVIFVHPGFDELSHRIGQLGSEEILRLRETRGVNSVLPRAPLEQDIRVGANTARAHLLGVDDAFIPLYRLRMPHGRVFLAEEVLKKQPVCLLSADMAKRLLPYSDPVGASIDVQGTPFQIIGTFEWDAAAAQRTSAGDVDVLVPLPWTLPNDNPNYSMLEVRVDRDFTAKQSVRLITNALSRGEKSREKLYFVRSMEQFVEKAKAMNDKLMTSLLSIAAISLLVGGIGIANVMVTSVTERTREVGIRKALGARRVDILLQFLVESSVLTGSGGALAVLSGALGINLYSSFFDSGIPLAIPVTSVAGCLILTVFIGLVAGVYPASRAASLSPAEALRYE